MTRFIVLLTDNILFSKTTLCDILIEMYMLYLFLLLPENEPLKSLKFMEILKKLNSIRSK